MEGRCGKGRSRKRLKNQYNQNPFFIISIPGLKLVEISAILLNRRRPLDILKIEKFTGHIVLLGLELIAVSIRPAKQLSLILDGDE